MSPWYMKNRISLLLALPVARIDKLAVKNRLREIGEIEGATHKAEAPIVTITIHHNSRLQTSRNTLAMIRQSGEEPVVIDS